MLSHHDTIRYSYNVFNRLSPIWFMMALYV